MNIIKRKKRPEPVQAEVVKMTPRGAFVSLAIPRERLVSETDALILHFIRRKVSVAEGTIIMYTLMRAQGVDFSRIGTLDEVMGKVALEKTPDQINAGRIV